MTTQRRRLATLVIMLATASCTTGPATNFLRQEAPDSRYRAVTLNFSSGQQVVVRYRIFNEQGKAALCGYLTGDGSFMDKDVTELWFQEASLLIAGQEFGKSDFLKHQWAGAGAPAPTANCVQSALEWNTTLTTAPVTFRGGSVRRVY